MRDLKRKLRRFERNYGITSEEFYERFSNGEMGDSVDVVEWFAYCDMYRKSADRIAEVSDTACCVLRKTR